MNKKLIPFLFLFIITDIIAQTPAISKTDKTNYSNSTLSPNEMVYNKAISQVKKIPLDTQSIIVYDYDGALFSYDLETEKLNWTVKATDSKLEMCANKITLHDGVVYVPFVNGEIFAIDNQSGDLFWKARLGSITDQIIFKDQIPVISNGKLFITAQNQDQSSNLYALDIKNGSLAWNYKLDTPNNDIPLLVFENKLFTQSGNTLYSFDVTNGKVLNQKTFEEVISGKPITDGENIFVANEKNVLYALNPNKLDIVWQFKFDETQNNIKERIFCKDKKIYFAAQGPTISSIYAIDSKAGIQIWKTDFKEDNIEYIVRENENIWGYTRKAKLFELDLTNGEVAFETKLTTLPVSNFEFPDDNNLFYYCDAGLIQFDLNEKDENVWYMRTSLMDNVYSAYLKIIR